MIINNHKDLEAAPDDVRERFVNALAGSINKYVWNGGEWTLEQNTAEIERFGFTIADFPDAPVHERERAHCQVRGPARRVVPHDSGNARRATPGHE